eukprot:1464704-Pleurochrysis_carterae.AAC.1
MCHDFERHAEIILDDEADTLSLTVARIRLTVTTLPILPVLAPCRKRRPCFNDGEASPGTLGTQYCRWSGGRSFRRSITAHSSQGREHCSYNLPIEPLSSQVGPDWFFTSSDSESSQLFSTNLEGEGQ